MTFSTTTNHQKKATEIFKSFNFTKAKYGTAGYEIARKNAMAAIDLLLRETQERGTTAYVYYLAIKEQIKNLK